MMVSETNSQHNTMIDM